MTWDKFCFHGCKKVINYIISQKTHRKQKPVCMTGLSVREESILEGNFSNTEHVVLNFRVNLE